MCWEDIYSPVLGRYKFPAVLYDAPVAKYVCVISPVQTNNLSCRNALQFVLSNAFVVSDWTSLHLYLEYELPMFKIYTNTSYLACITL